MGKQINYYMEYESFLQVAQKALDLGFEILRKDKKSGNYFISRDLSIVDKKHRNYFFHLPEEGEISFKDNNGESYLDHYYNACGNSVIEAGYSYITDNEKEKSISRARLFCITGYYDESGEFVPRSDNMTKSYNSLVRAVKKISPYTEITDKRVSRDENEDPVEYKYKIYITKHCLYLKENGFELG